MKNKYVSQKSKNIFSVLLTTWLNCLKFPLRKYLKTFAENLQASCLYETISGK